MLSNQVSVIGPNTIKSSSCRGTQHYQIKSLSWDQTLAPISALSTQYPFQQKHTCVHHGLERSWLRNN